MIRVRRKFKSIDDVAIDCVQIQMNVETFTLFYKSGCSMCEDVLSFVGTRKKSFNRVRMEIKCIGSYSVINEHPILHTEKSVFIGKDIRLFLSFEFMRRYFNYRSIITVLKMIMWKNENEKWCDNLFCSLPQEMIMSILEYV